MNLSEHAGNKIKSYCDAMLDTNGILFCIWKDNIHVIDIENVGRKNEYDLSVKDCEVHDKYGISPDMLCFYNKEQLDNFINNHFESNADFFNQFYRTDEEADKRMTNAIQEFTGTDIEIGRRYGNQYNILYGFSLMPKDSAIRVAITNCSSKTSFNPATVNNFHKHQAILESELRPYSMTADTVLPQLICKSRYFDSCYETDLERHIDRALNLTNQIVDIVYNEDVLRNGVKGRFKSEVNRIMADICNIIQSSKVLPKMDTLTYTYNKINTYNSNAERERIFNQISKDLHGPERAEDIETIYSIKANVQFEHMLSMQVKNTVKKKVNQYLIDNNIRLASSVNYGDDGKLTHNAQFIELCFYCNDYEAIGVDQIKFLVPKLGGGMKGLKDKLAAARSQTEQHIGKGIMSGMSKGMAKFE